MNARFCPARVRVLGSGSALPGEAIDNQRLLDEIEKIAGSLQARKARLIGRRLGICRRHFSRRLDQPVSAPDPDAPELCCQALRRAAAQAGGSLAQLEYLIGHTTSPHTLVPPNVAWVADRLGLEQPYMELRQACTGFASALQIAAPMLAVNERREASVAVVGSEVGSVYLRLAKDQIDDEQLVNMMQMGDGAGAVLLGPGHSNDNEVISDLFVGQLGNGRKPGLYLEGGGSVAAHCATGMPRFRHDVQAVRGGGADLFMAGLQAVNERGYALEDFRFIIPHQVNGHLARLLAEALSIDPSMVVVDADVLGNLGSAAIWVSFDRLRRSGRLQRGDKILVLGAEATKYLYGGFVYTH